jgi:P4 family phage/plasmid primase-like protien
VPSPLIAVLPHRHVTGAGSSPWLWTPPAAIANITGALPAEVLPLRDALERRWFTDAHLASYVVHDASGRALRRQVRLVKAELADVRARGLVVLHYVRMADLDTIPHDAHLTSRQLDEVVRRAEGEGLALYPTTKGFRVIEVYQDPVTPETHEHHYPAFRARVANMFGPGYHVDDCRDWTRIFRLPRVTRAHEETGLPAYSTLADTYYLDGTRATAVEPFTPLPVDPQERTLQPFHPADADVLERAAKYVCEIPTPGCGTSSCDSETYRVAHELVKGFSLAVDQALPVLEAWASRATHRWRDGELRRKLDNAASAPTTTGYRLREGADLFFRASYLTCDDILEDRDVDAALAVPEWPRDTLAYGTEPELRDAVLRNLTQGHPEHVVYTRTKLFQYEPGAGVWKELADARVINDVAAYDLTCLERGSRNEHPLRITNAKAKGVLELVKRLREVPDFFDSPPRGVAFTNGFVSIDLKTGVLTLKAHDPENRARFAYPFAYSPDGGRPMRYLRMLYRACRALPDRDKADVMQLLLEHLGASIMGVATRFERAIVLWGDGGTGNSTIVKIHAACMPPRSVGSTSPSMFENQFHRAQLEGRLLNVVDDLPKDEMRNAGPWKTIITGGPVEAAHKNKPPFTFCCIAGQLWACNEPPPVTDAGHAFRRRTTVLRFTSKLDESEKRRDMAEHVLEEKDIIIHSALRMLSNAISRNALTIPSHSQEYLDEWVRGSDAKEVFFEDELVLLTPEQRGSPELWMSATLIYQRFVRWCAEKGHKPCSDTKFGTWLRDKLGVKPADARQAPFKRATGKFYPVYFARTATELAESEEAAKGLNAHYGAN